jgi:hypothetical protein
MPDDHLAAKLGRTTGAIRGRRNQQHLPPFQRKYPAWAPEHLRLLGKFTDAEVADRTGHSPGAVQTQRLKLRIPVLRSQLYHQWAPADEALLGTVPDNDVARCLGCTRGAVKTRRNRLGIPAYTQGPQRNALR